MVWQPTQPIDFTEDGDTTSVAIKKHDTDISVLYELLNRLRRFDYGENPPVDPDEWSFWLAKGSDGKPSHLRVFHNGKWCRVAGVSVGKPDINYECQNGVFWLSKDSNNIWNLSIFFNGQWYLITNYAQTSANHKLQLDGDGCVYYSLIGHRNITVNPSSATNMNVNETVLFHAENTQTLDLRNINANNGLYRIIVVAHGIGDGFNTIRLRLNGSLYSNAISSNCFIGGSNGQENQWYYQTTADAMRLVVGKEIMADCLFSTRQDEAYLISRAIADDAEVQQGTNAGRTIQMYAHTVRNKNIAINNLGIIYFPTSGVDALTVIERLM